MSQLSDIVKLKYLSYLKELSTIGDNIDYLDKDSLEEYSDKLDKIKEIVEDAIIRIDERIIKNKIKSIMEEYIKKYSDKKLKMAKIILNELFLTLRFKYINSLDISGSVDEEHVTHTYDLEYSYKLFNNINVDTGIHFFTQCHGTYRDLSIGIKVNGNRVCELSSFEEKEYDIKIDNLLTNHAGKYASKNLDMREIIKITTDVVKGLNSCVMNIHFKDKENCENSLFNSIVINK
ncbi:hypothetical protein QKU48_gp0741 [Fadolivirus algeromassiliense]|jgi:hypothetical protein|uniref:Uncharacterized protein n=1 Tax=Fadolivirus FV1/VV64 TaxID=3070911 RepID=A0A7D3QW41_9VIRU|nr:hypothetical protein QKU48_gp0741 [Fadolivirus algeromassiliense]QKF94199.1 hypothetical protein Fadolivirus_1_741 [Fadolivirus FV1/VV64]